jgi:hypothetical protein
VKDTTFEGGARNYISGFEGSQAQCPFVLLVNVMHMMGINSLHDVGRAAL